MDEELSDADFGLLSDEQMGFGATQPEPQQQSAAPRQQAELSDKDFGLLSDDDFLGRAEKPESEGALGTFVREAAHAVVPATTGILAGGALGALAAPTIAGALGAGPVGAVAGFAVGAGGMLLGSMAGEYVQDKALKAAGVDDDVQRAVNKEDHGVASFMGGVSPFLGNPVLAAEKGAGLAGQFTGKNLAQRAVGSGVMTAFEGGQQIVNGEFHPGELLGNAAVGFAMPAGNRFTQAVHGAGESVGGKFAPGRPDTAAPNAGADKADAAVSESPDVAGGNANAQQAAADPKGAIGYENSKAQGPTDGTKKKSTIDEVFGETGKKGFSQGDVTADPTMQAALGGKATLAPETPGPANVGRVVDTGIPTAQGAPYDQAASRKAAQAQIDAANAAAPQVHPDVQAAMDRNAEILREYNGKRQPTEIKQEFDRNRRVIFAERGPKPPTATLASEAPVAAPVEAPKPPTATLAPEAPADTTGLRAMGSGMAKGITDNLYDHLWSRVEAGKITETSNGQPTALLQGAKMIRDRGGLKSIEELKAYAADQAKLDPSDPSFQQDMRDIVEKHSPGADTPQQQAERLAKIEARKNAPQATLAPEAPASAPRAAPVEAASDAPIVVQPKVNKRLAREDDAMTAKLREMGWNETADKLEQTPEADRPALRKQIAEALPRDRGKEKEDLKNKIGMQANSPADRDRHNSAIDAIQKAFDEHAPKENETAQELVDRLRGAVNTAMTAHEGQRPLHNTEGYRPQKLPNTFQWYRKVQEKAGYQPEYWTQDKIDAFKADENATREANAEYPTQDPRLLDASIEKSGRGGNVADRVLETQGTKSHEDAVLERTNLENARRAIGELYKLFRGEHDLENMSDKARAILDAMPKEVRKAGFESGEKGADPSHIAKVVEWLKEYHDDKKPWATIDTHGDETGFVKPKERPVTSRADLGRATLAEEGASTDLVKPVQEKPKAKTKTKTKEKKYDFEAKTTSGKELSPEEAARILKASEDLQTKDQSRAAPKPTFEGGETDKYSPLKVGIKDMLGSIVDNERGALDIKKIGADFKKLFDKFATLMPPKTGKLDDNWDIKIEPTYIAKRVKTEPQQAGRNIADMLNRAGKVDNVIKVHALAAKEQAHILAATKEQQRQMYDALEKRDPNLITDPHLRDIFEHSIIPAHVETAALREWIKEHHPEVDIGRDTEDGVHRRALNGRNAEMELESIGENADPTAGSSPISTTKRSPVMERQFAALEDADGNRHIVHLKIGENGKPTGEFSVWKDYKNHEMDKAPPMEFKKVNDLYKIGDRTFKMKDATTDEIHRNALGSDGKPMDYQRDAAASVYTANAYFRQLANHLQTLDQIKASREFGKYATDKKDLAKEGWKQSEVPGFQKYWMDDHIRESLEDAYQQGFADSALNKIRNFSRAVTQSIFWTPIAHIMNVEVHWAVGRGFKWLPNDLVGGRNYRDLAETGAQAIKSVVSFDRIQKILHEEGAGLIFGGTRGENATRRLAQGVGEAIQKNPGKWEGIANKMGLPVGDLIRGVYKASRTAMWSVNDMFLTQAILEHLKGNGKNIDTASKQEIREAIAHIEKHIPNYRTPSRIISDDVNGRAIAKGMRDPLVFGFGRYRYAVFNSFANMTNSVLHGTKAERIETAGQMIVMGAVAFGVYPLLYKPLAQLLTGNDAAETRGRGPVAPIMHIKDDLFGRGDIWPLVRETISVSPLASTAMEFLRGKDFGGRDIINKKDFHDALRGDVKAGAKAAVQGAGWAAGQRYSPVSTLNSSLNNPRQGVLGGLRDAVLDIKNPSDKAQKYDAQTPRRLQQEDNRRRKTQPNIGDKILGGLGIN